MAETQPYVTIIIPARPGQKDLRAVEAVGKLDYPRDRLEVIVARGKQPAVQRNRALGQSHGELVYFLDDDAVPMSGGLGRAVSHFQKEGVMMVGGPNLCPREAPLLEQVFAVVLGSWLAFGPSRARYDAVGDVRETNEKELILCNLLASRRALEEAGGFDESLYPNEENALMDDLQRRGGKLLYDPRFVVHRRPRPSLGAFSRMLFNYGRGRAEQFRLHPTPGSILNFVPPVFCLYLVLLPALGGWGWVPLALYGGAVGLQVVISSLGRAGWKALLALPFIVLTHVAYGLGFWRGLFTRIEKDPTASEADVALEILDLGDLSN